MNGRRLGTPRLRIALLARGETGLGAAQGIAISVRGQAAQSPEWVEGWTFRMRDVRLTFRTGTTADRAAELQFDTGGDHFVLKREPTGE